MAARWPHHHPRGAPVSGSLTAYIITILYVLGVLTTGALAQPSFVPPARFSVPLTRSTSRLHYTVQVVLGNPPQEMNLILDTGSDKAFVFSSDHCLASDTLSGGYAAAGPCYNSSKSNTVVPMNRTSSLNLYLDQGDRVRISNGDVYQDDAHFNMKVVGRLPIVVPSETVRGDFILVDSNYVTSSNIRHFFNDVHGLMGASFQTDSTRSAESLFHNLMSSFVVSLFDAARYEPLFALDFGEDGGEMQVGGILEEYRDVIRWSAFGSSAYFHTFELYDLTICNTVLNTPEEGYHVGFADTASSCLGLPSGLFEALVSWFPIECTDSPVCYLPEDTEIQLPTLSFRLSFSGELLYLRLQDLLIPAVGMLSESASLFLFLSTCCGCGDLKSH